MDGATKIKVRPCKVLVIVFATVFLWCFGGMGAALAATNNGPVGDVSQGHLHGDDQNPPIGQDVQKEIQLVIENVNVTEHCSKRCYDIGAVQMIFVQPTGSESYLVWTCQELTQKQKQEVIQVLQGIKKGFGKVSERNTMFCSGGAISHNGGIYFGRSKIFYDGQKWLTFCDAKQWAKFGTANLKFVPTESPAEDPTEEPGQEQGGDQEQGAGQEQGDNQGGGTGQEQGGDQEQGTGQEQGGDQEQGTGQEQGGDQGGGSDQGQGDEQQEEPAQKQTSRVFRKLVVLAPEPADIIQPTVVEPQTENQIGETSEPQKIVLGPTGIVSTKQTETEKVKSETLIQTGNYGTEIYLAGMGILCILMGIYCSIKLKKGKNV